jgi:DNA-binding SARP family transcriptional activator
VSLDRLSTALWGSKVPALARNGVQGCVSKIRRVFELVGPPSAELELTTLGMGYCLRIPRSTVDLLRFREAVRASAVSDPVEAHALLRSGLSQWRGPALSDVAGSWLADNVVPELEEERLSALEQRISLDLVRRRDRDVVKELSALIVEFPWREHLVCLQGIALHRCGRRVEALALLRRWRRRFVDELGIEPGRAFQDLHQTLLDDRESTVPLPVPGGALEVTLSPPRVKPDGPTIRQLPAVTSHLVGRRNELRTLDTDEGGRISVISGTAGMGKTTLALHWAQRSVDRFPDGQLHLDLRGFGPNSTPAQPAEALRTMLRILQVPAERIPADLDGQIALYRSMVADRRMIIVLDNVRDAEQVRPLLPGAPGHAVLITSRNELTSLIAREGARSLSLAAMSADEAREILCHRIGAGRVAAEPGAVDDIVARCAGLPLALAIVSARAAARPHIALETLVWQGDGRATLDTFDGGDSSTRIRSVFSWSYRTLTDEAARLFRLLGLHPGPDVTVETAATLAGVSTAQAGRLLAELAGGHLINERAAGRYGLHDLLRAYAADLVRSEDELVAQLSGCSVTI